MQDGPGIWQKVWQKVNQKPITGKMGENPPNKNWTTLYCYKKRLQAVVISQGSVIKYWQCRTPKLLFQTLFLVCHFGTVRNGNRKVILLKFYRFVSSLTSFLLEIRLSFTCVFTVIAILFRGTQTFSCHCIYCGRLADLASQRNSS